MAYLQRTPGNPGPFALAQGRQNDGAGTLWSVIAHTPNGDIPGKAIGANAWYPFGGKEHTTGDFSYIVGGHALVQNQGGPPPNAAALGRQNDCGTVWPVIANTPHGTIPGKAIGNNAWYPYGGAEHTTSDFSWIVHSHYLAHVRQHPQPSAWSGAPHGRQNDAGDVFCIIAHTPQGNIPGKAIGTNAWYPYGGKEHTTGDFSWIVGQAHLVKTNNPLHAALGNQTDCGSVWPAIANTPHGTIPGKAIGGTCWYPYGGVEHTTNDFFYVVPHQ